MPLPYPQTRRDDVVDLVHGESVADPYRWLEDTASPETAEWVKLQNELTESVLSTLPDRAAIRNRLTRVWDAVARTRSLLPRLESILRA